MPESFWKVLTGLKTGCPDEFVKKSPKFLAKIKVYFLPWKKAAPKNTNLDP
jgi:hypothetical protein